MFEIWIPLTIAGAFFQNLRSALQKHLKAHLSTAGATYVRFFYAWPFAIIYLFGLAHFGGYEIPKPNATTPRANPSAKAQCRTQTDENPNAAYPAAWPSAPSEDSKPMNT